MLSLCALSVCGHQLMFSGRRAGRGGEGKNTINMLEMGRFTEFITSFGGELPERSSGKQPVPETVILKLQKAILPWLFLISIIKVLDQADAPMPMPSFASDLKLHDLDNLVGNIFFFFGAIVFMIPSTLLQARIGNVKWLAYLVGGIGVAGVLMATVRGADTLIVMRFLIGLLAAGITPGIYIFMASLFSHHELTLGVAIVSAGHILGQVLQGPLTSGFLSLESFGFVRGWQWMFVLFGAFTIAFAAALWVALPKEVAGMRLLTAEEREWLEERQEAISRIAARRARQNGKAVMPFITWQMYRLGMRTCWCNASSARCCTSTRSTCEASYLGMYLDTPYDELVDKHPGLAGWLAAGLHVPAMLCTLALGWHSYVQSERKMHVALPLMVGAFPLVLTPICTARFGASAGYFMLIIAVIPVCAVCAPIISWVAALFHGRALLTAFPMLLLWGTLGELWLGPTLVQGFVQVQGAGVSNVLVMLGLLEFVTGVLFLDAGTKVGDLVPAQPNEPPIVPPEDLEDFLPVRQAQE
eukprot:jgi/Botrbrau1/7172/Bobra.0300s0005.1